MTPWLPLILACSERTYAPPPPPEPVPVAHQRELRALWVATVANIDWPTKPGAPATEQQAELEALVEVASATGFNAIFFQVRSAADAMYDSPHEPWSRALTGVEGQDPGYDPLKELIDLAEPRGIEVHAWFNPYRTATTSVKHADNHVSKTRPDHVLPYGSLRWLDPGLEGSRDQLEDVVLDVVQRYDVAGVHFDDYFYPYPEARRPFPDDASYAAYRASGGTLERPDWRIENVHQMVERISKGVQADEGEVRFGISPFGIYRPGIPEGITGLDQVASLHADPLAWSARGWVDYLAPQLYWPTTRERQAYGRLAGWWSDTLEPQTDCFAGLYLSQVGSSKDWTPEEFEQQVAIARASRGIQGQVWFSARPLLEDREGMQGVIAGLYERPALPPQIRRIEGDGPLPPAVELRDGDVCIEPVESARRYTLYRGEGDGWVLDRVISGELEPLSLAPGSWAVAAVSRGGVESLGTVVTVPSGPVGPRGPDRPPEHEPPP